MKFSTRLREVLKEKGINQTELSKMTDISKSVISEWLSDKYEPKQDKVYIVAEKLSVSPSWLFGVSNEKEVKSDLMSIYNELTPQRQIKVYNFAEKQLDEQNNIIHMSDHKTIVTNRRTAAGSALHVEDADARKEVVSSALIPKGADELVEVVGKSMEPLIMDGQEIYMRYQPSVENGEIAIVRIENEGVTCKRVYANNGTITLKSENEEYDDMHFDASQVVVLGKVLL